MYLLLLLFIATVLDARRVELCEDVGERVHESSVLEDYRGRSVILAFTELHCHGCATRLLRLTEVSRHFQIDVLIVTSPNERSEDLRKAAQDYPRLRFEAAPCSPCEFDYLLDTNSSRIFVLDGCARLLHRYERSAEHLTQLRDKFPLQHSCGPACTERRKRDPNELPPVGCGSRKMLSQNEMEETPYTGTNAQQQQQLANQKNRQYKQIFQSGSQRPTPQSSQAQIPQPVVSGGYNNKKQSQQQYENLFFQTSPITHTQPVYQTEQVQQQQIRQQVYTSNKPGTPIKGRYQKYQESPQQPQQTATTTPSPTQRSNPATNRYNIERLEEQRRYLAKQREEHARKLKLQNELQTGHSGLSTQLEVPPTTSTSQPSDDGDAVSFTQAFRTQHHHHLQDRQQTADRKQTMPVITTTPRPTQPTTHRPPKTTKVPLVYSNVPSSRNFGHRTYGRQPYESSYQMQQKRRNELAAQRQRLIQERHQQELEQLQRQELQRQIAEQEARQAAAKAAYEQRLNAGKLETAPLYHEDNGEVAETVDLTDYYEDVEEWTTAIPQLRLESPPSPEPLSENPAEHPEFLFDLPCNGFSDEICYQQQIQLEPKEVHKCCQARIVLTDQCVPGRCSNVTNQLCCIQRLLQSKFKCCNDKRQGEVLFAGDSFSRCCYDNFVEEEDPCCPQAYSMNQWRSIYELCLPAVSVDLSHVRVPQKAVAGLSTTVSFDFSKTDKWRFDCKYGGHVPQYSYFPPSLEEEMDKSS